MSLLPPLAKSNFYKFCLFFFYVHACACTNLSSKIILLNHLVIYVSENQQEFVTN